jgi:hypothetical protein
MPSTPWAVIHACFVWHPALFTSTSRRGCCAWKVNTNVRMLSWHVRSSRGPTSTLPKLLTLSAPVLLPCPVADPEARRGAHSSVPLGNPGSPTELVSPSLPKQPASEEMDVAASWAADKFRHASTTRKPRFTSSKAVSLHATCRWTPESLVHMPGAGDPARQYS